MGLIVSFSYDVCVMILVRILKIITQHAKFTLLCVSVDGMLGSEAVFFVKRMSDFLAAKWERPYSVVSGWVRARLSFAILRAALLCVRDSCTKMEELGNY